MANTQEFPRGQLSTVILMCLSETDKYGYEIIEEVLKKTNGALSIKQPSLYSSLKRMEEQSLISSYWRDSEIGGRRHYYHLTDLGKKHLEKWQTNITLPTAPQQEAQSTTKVLHQENLFNLSNTQNPSQIEEKENHTQSADKTFVQFDLFTNAQIITPPSTEPADATENILNNQISIGETLQSPKQNPIVTQYRTEDVPESIQKFDYVKKTNASFTDSIKKITNIETKKFVENPKQTFVSTLENQEKQEISTKNNDLYSQKTFNEKDEFSLNPNVNENEQTINIALNNENFEIETNISQPELTENYCKVSAHNLSGYNFAKLPLENSCTEVPSTFTNNKNNLANNETESQITNEIPLPQKESVKDDGVFITERLDPKDLPKQPRIEPRRFEIYLSDNSISPKFKTKQNDNYEDRVKELYEKSKSNAENQELELIDSKLKFSSYEDLQQFYSEQNIKFKPYQKTLYKSEKNFDMIKVNKLNLFTSLFMFVSVSLISIIFGIIFSNIQNVLLNSPITFFVAPLTALLWLTHSFIVHQKSPEKRIAYDTNKFKFNIFAFILSLLLIPIIFAFNLLFGFTFASFQKYALTILYPCSLSFAYIIYYFIQKVLTRHKGLY